MNRPIIKTLCPTCERETYIKGYGCTNCDYNVQNIANERLDTHYFDGSTAARAIPPVHVKSLLENAALDPDVSNERAAWLYAKISRDFLDGKLPGKDSWVTWRNMVSQIGKIGGIK